MDKTINKTERFDIYDIEGMTRLYKAAYKIPELGYGWDWGYVSDARIEREKLVIVPTAEDPDNWAE